MKKIIFVGMGFLLSSCVSVENLPDVRGALKPGMRLVVIVSQSPGPWLVDAADTKAEAAAKLSPMGILVQSVQNSHILSVSKSIQPYLPRPHYGVEVSSTLISGLKIAASSATILTGTEAGISLEQLSQWNRASDQLDWRLKYYAPDPAAPPSRDYSSILTLDDALILDVNISFGTTASEEGQLMPQISAASRVYRGDTSRLIWENEEEFTDKSSSFSLAEFQLQPAELTNRIFKMSPALGEKVAASFVKAFALIPVKSTTTATSPAISGGGLLPASFFENMSSSATSTTPSISSVTAAAPQINISTPSTSHSP